MSNPLSHTSVIGEVVASTTETFSAHCIEVPASIHPKFLDPPAFGSIVRIVSSQAGADKLSHTDQFEDEPDPFAAGALKSLMQFSPGTVLAVITNTEMTSMERGRVPMALGCETEEDLRMRHPQVFELIITSFSGLQFGYADDDGRLSLRVPPIPARIHSRVYACTQTETVAATMDLRYLSRILRGDSSAYPAEELCAAVIRHGWIARQKSSAYLHDAGRQMAMTVGDEYQRLQRILQAVVG